MRRTLRTFLASLAAIAGVSSYSAPAVFDLQALAQESAGIYLVDVQEIINPEWKDGAGHEVLIAIATVETTVKGHQRRDLTFCFKPMISDQPKFGAGSRYVVFIFGQQRPVVLDHQPRALAVQGEVVETSGLRGEPHLQPLAPFIARIKQMKP